MDLRVDPSVRRHVLDTVWNDFYALGGYGMYPTTLFGFGLLLLALMYLFRLEERYLPMVKTLSLLTLAGGVLGTTTGLMVVFRFVQHVGPADQVRVAALGCAEAINNIVLALILAILGGLVMLGAFVRKGLRAGTRA